MTDSATAQADEESIPEQLHRARAQIRALEQLLEVHEHTSLEQARRLEQAMRAVQAERQRLYEVFMQAPAAITLLEGPEHVFTVVNPLYHELIGGRDVQGKTVREALPELDGQGFYELLDGVYASGEPFSAREMLVRLDRDGDGIVEDLYVDFVYQPLLDSSDTVFGIMAHAVDVSPQVQARKQIEQKAAELLRLTEQLEQSNRDLDQFAYVASHDLKAPLRGIANLTEWIEEDLGDRVTGESANHMELLKGRVNRMEALIDGILAYSRAGRVRDKVERVDIGALLQETIEMLAPPPTMSVTVVTDMPTLEAERTPLQQVFMNLIGNAIKYSAREDATIRVAASPDGDSHFRFSISDNGPGIAPQYHERIWEIFQMLAPRDKVEGTGIGLSVVRKLVDTRGGRAWLDSAPGRGTTVHFTWPIRPRTSS